MSPSSGHIVSSDENDGRKAISIIHVDGRTLEGGGQLVRCAVALSALTGYPITVSNIRGSRHGRKGLKGSHAAAIKFIAEVCGGEVLDGHVGSHTMTFYPRKINLQRHPGQTKSETSAAATSPKRETLFNPHAPMMKAEYNIRQDTVGSISLVFQALYPYLVCACNLSETVKAKGPIKVHITGGTNVSFSPSFDYIEQVLAPNLQTLGLPELNVKLYHRGWSTGPEDLGAVAFEVYPLQTPSKSRSRPSFPILKLQDYKRRVVSRIEITILAPDANIQEIETKGKHPRDRHRETYGESRDYENVGYGHWTIREYLEEQSVKSLRKALKDLNCGAVKRDDDTAIANVPIEIRLSEATRHHTHMYILMVAHLSNGIKLGRDAQFDGYDKRNGRKGSGRSFSVTLKDLIDRCVAGIVEELEETQGNDPGAYRPVVDVYMRDQLVVFEALGIWSELWSPAAGVEGADIVNKIAETTSEDERYWSLHTRTARWVCEHMLGEGIWKRLALADLSLV